MAIVVQQCLRIYAITKSIPPWAASVGRYQENYEYIMCYQ